MKDSLIFIEHILENIDDIKEFSKGMSKEKFLKDKLKQKGIIRSIEIIGEAVKNLPIDFTIKYPFVEWSKIAGTRDKMIHNYFGIDIELIWDMIKNDIPKLEKDIKEILDKEKNLLS